jgi:hypothetical protein
MRLNDQGASMAIVRTNNVSQEAPMEHVAGIPARQATQNATENTRAPET